MKNLKTQIFWPQLTNRTPQEWIKDFLWRLSEEWRTLANTYNGHYHSDNIYVPDSITTVAGTPTGSVTDITTALDGNVYHVTEAAATPGFNVEMVFSNIFHFTNINIRADYNGSNTHWVGVELYDYIAAGYKQIGIMPTTDQYYQWHNFRLHSYTNFISAANEVKIRIYHYTAGNPAHSLSLDFVALTQTAYQAN